MSWQDRDGMSDARLVSFLRALPQLCIEVTAEGRYTDFIAGPEELLAMPRAALQGRHLREVLPPDAAALAEAALDEVIRTGSCAPRRYRLPTAAGLRWFLLTGARKAPDAPGGAPSAVFAIRDITEEEARNRQFARLAAIVEAMTNMVVIIDSDQRITWANPAWEACFGWRLEEVQGRLLADLVRPAGEDPANAAAVSAAIAEGRSYRGRTVNIDRQGRRLWIDFNILPLRDDDGAIQGYVSVETDVTELHESRRRAAEAAEAAERARERLDNALEALPDGVVIWDCDDRLVAVNAAYKRMYPEVADILAPGVSQEEVLRTGVARRAFPSAWGREEAWIAEQRERYRNPTIDEIARADGRWIRRLDLRTADGGRIAVRTDTTERHQQIEALAAANRALAEARAALAGTLERANVGAWEWNVETGALRIAGTYAAMLGYSAEDFGPPSYARFRELVHPEDLARLDATDPVSYRQPDSGPEPVIEQLFRMRHRDGRWVWILSRTAVADRDAQGQPRRMVGVHLDITERKRLEERVLEDRKFLDAVMEASVAAIAVLDAQGRIVFANAAAERLLGLERSRLAGIRYDDPGWQVATLAGDPVPPEAMPFRLALDSGRPVRDIRHAVTARDGVRRILSISAAPFRRGEGTGDIMVVTSFLDVTEEVAREHRLEQALAEAEQASRAKSTFLANMSHEIRTPLNGVLGMAEVLEGRISDPEQREMVATIRRSGELLLHVLNDILDMSKIEAGKMTLEAIPFVPAEIAASVERLNALHAEGKGLIFEVLRGTGAGRPRLGDPHRIQQILNNLVGNAIKFTQAGSVRLTVSAPGGRPLVFELRDTGIGMTEEQLGRIFNSFEQAEGGTTRRFGGTGLGMAIVRKLVDMMGGEIAIASSPGVGTQVRVSLPLPETQMPVAPQTEPAEEDVGFGTLAGRHILIADDSETNRRVVAQMLTGLGAELTFAGNGAEAVSAYERLLRQGRPPDLLLLDISMPVMDGRQALAAIRALAGADPAVPAIAVTANVLPHQVAEYLRSGFDAHVSKPFRRPVLVRSLVAALRRREQG